MNFTNIDEVTNPQLSDKEIFESLKYAFFNAAEELGLGKYAAISALLQKVTQVELLNKTIYFLKRNGFDLKNTNPFLDTLAPSQDYSSQDLVKISAHLYSLQFLFIVYTKINASLNHFYAHSVDSRVPIELPSLSINVNGRIIADNTDEAYDIIRKKGTLITKANASSTNAKEGKTILSESIAAMAEMEYLENAPGFFKAEIDFLSRAKNNLIAQQALSTTYNDSIIFRENGRILWDHIFENYVTPGYGKASDIAYFYWRMADPHNEFIHVRPEEFKRKFLEPRGIEVGQFKKLENLSDVNRKRHYSLALEWLKNHLSDE